MYANIKCMCLHNNIIKVQRSVSEIESTSRLYSSNCKITNVLHGVVFHEFEPINQ